MLENALAQMGKLSREYPRLNAMVSEALANRDREGAVWWPREIFLPGAVWNRIHDAHKDRFLNREGETPHGYMARKERLMAIGTWRYTQGVYRFDETLAEELARTEITGNLPCEVLKRLPQWCVYLDHPFESYRGPAEGVWVYLSENVPEEGEPNLALMALFLLTNGEVDAASVDLRDDTIEGALAASREASVDIGRKLASRGFIEESRIDGLIEGMHEAYGKMIRQVLPFVLYLCSDEPEVSADRVPAGGSRSLPMTKVKGGFKLFPPSGPSVHVVGEAVGRGLREALASRGGIEKTGASKRPHVRSAHWHGYWHGPRDGERVFKYHWLPPTLIGANR